MQKLVVPFSETVNYVYDVAEHLPRGHGLPESGPKRTEMILDAVAGFTAAYIKTNLRHIRRKPDPMLEFLQGLGYPVATLQDEELFDELCIELDEMFLDLAVITDMVIGPLIEMVGNRNIDVEHVPNSEDLTITLGEDVVIERYKELLGRVKRVSAPKMIRELGDLTEFEEYITHSVNEVFKHVTHPAVKDEVKRMYLDIVGRQ